jgi:hypothetical protein
MFERLVWLDESSARLGDLSFVIAEGATLEQTILDKRYFILLKSRSMLESYEQFFARRDFRPRNVMELGTGCTIRRPTARVD